MKIKKIKTFVARGFIINLIKLSINNKYVTVAQAQGGKDYLLHIEGEKIGRRLTPKELDQEIKKLSRT